MGRIIKAGEQSTKPNRIAPENDQAAVELVAVWSAIRRLRSQAKNDIINLALDMARRVIGKAVELDPALLEAIYAQALAPVREMGPGTISVHPEDRALSNLDDFARDHGFDVKVDPQVGRFGCRVQAGDLEVDATLDTVLQAFKSAMKGSSSE